MTVETCEEWLLLLLCSPKPWKEKTMAHPSTELGPFFSFHWGRNVSRLKWMRNAGRLTVWTRWFAFSVGRRFPLHDGWPE